MKKAEIKAKLRGAVINSYIDIFQILPFGFAKGIEIFIFRNVLRKKDKIHAYYLSRKKARKKYCIYRYCLPHIGLMATAINYIFQYKFTVSKGFIPIIDLEPTKVFEDGRLNEMNMWEKVFVQAMPLADVMNQDYVIVDMPGNLMYSRKTAKIINGDRKKDRIYTRQKNWRKYYRNIHVHIKNAWKIRPDVQRVCDAFFSHCFDGRQKILGIMLREEFSEEYNSLLDGAEAELYAKHPLGPNVQEIIGVVKALRDKWGFDKIFLATMYIESVKKFKNTFGDDVVFIERERRTMDYKNDSKRRKADATAEENYALYKSHMQFFIDESLSYVYELILLSKCDFFVGAHCSGTASALAINGGKFEDIYILPDYREMPDY